MKKKSFTKKFLSITTCLSLVVGIGCVPGKASADSIDTSKWQNSIAIDFGTTSSALAGGPLLTTPYPETADSLADVVQGYGYWTYDTTTIQDIYGVEDNPVTAQKMGFNTSMPSGKSTTGGDYFNDWVFSPNGEEYNFSVDLPIGQYYVYIYTGNKQSGHNNTTFVSFGDQIKDTAIKYDQTSNGGSQFWGETKTELVYIVDVTDNGLGYGTMTATFSDPTLENEAYSSSHGTTIANALENGVGILDFYSEESYAIDTTDLENAIITSRLNGIEIAPVASPTHAKNISAPEVATVELSNSLYVSPNHGVSDCTDRIIYMSSNPEVATVDIYSGLISPITLGSTEIYSYNAYLNEYATTAVSVITETTIDLDKKTLALKVDDTSEALTGELIATINESDIDVFEWKVSDSSIVELGTPSFTAGTEASTSKISLTAKNTGTATITATRTDSNKSITCTVTVTRPVKSVALTDDKGNTFEEDAVINLVSGDTTTIGSIVTPDNASETGVTYTSSNRSVATVIGSGDSAKITAVGAGETIITVTAKGDTTLSDSIKVVVTAPKVTPSPVPINTPSPTAMPTPTVTPTAPVINETASPVTKITLSGTKTSTIKRKKTATLKVAINNSTIKSIKYSVKTGKKNVTVKVKGKKSIKVTGKKIGKAKITFTITAKDKTTFKVTRTFKITK